MNFLVRHLKLFVFFIILLNQTSTLYLGSFNIQSFGPTKIARPEFVDTVVKILSKYDIVLIQEIKGLILNEYFINFIHKIK